MCQRKLNEFETGKEKKITMKESGAPNDNFRKNICSEEDLRSRIFGTAICCKISCLPASPRIFEHLKNGKIAHFQWIFTLKRSPRIVGSLFYG